MRPAVVVMSVRFGAAVCTVLGMTAVPGSPQITGYTAFENIVGLTALR